MNLETFARQISFRFVGPENQLQWYRRFDHRMAKLGFSLDVINTRLPNDRRNTHSVLRTLAGQVPRMSTYANAALIDKAVSSMPAGTAFVNVGVWHGFSFLSGISNNQHTRCIGIDNFSQFGGPKHEFLSRFEKCRSDYHEFHEMDYKDYFSKHHNGPIGFYIYDGEHSYQNQLQGLETAEPFFAKNCVILVDDTNDEEPRQATLEFINRRPNRYRLLADWRTSCNQHPTFWNGIILFMAT